MANCKKTLFLHKIIIMRKTIRRKDDFFTSASRELNRATGDNTGRTVTYKAQDGIENIVGVRPSSDLLHLTMVASTTALFSENPKVKNAGKISWGLILLGWLAG